MTARFPEIGNESTLSVTLLFSWLIVFLMVDEIRKQSRFTIKS